MVTQLGVMLGHTTSSQSRRRIIQLTFHNSLELASPMKTAKETVEFVLNHLIQQGEPSVSLGRSCVYRLVKDGKTLKCAVGCCISDEEYSASMENNGLKELMQKFPFVMAGFNQQSLFLMQQFHDQLGLLGLSPSLFVFYCSNALNTSIYETEDYYYIPDMALRVANILAYAKTHPYWL